VLPHPIHLQTLGRQNAASNQQQPTRKSSMKKKSAQQKKISKVMREFKKGKLKSSSGQKVTKPAQAKAIAMSEAGMSKKKKGN
jgi:hypothetical protein